MKITILALFPDEMKQFFLKGIFQKAAKKNLFEIQFINIRDFTVDRYKKVDDYPFGKQKGMLLKPDILERAITSIENYHRYRVIYPCPKGKIFNQTLANQLGQEDGIILICGYYEGMDERLISRFNIQKISMGDFVLSSGELPSLMIAEAVIRLIPDVVGKKSSVEEDSFISGLLEYPQYTHPREFSGMQVPEVLISGHHQKIQEWKKRESLKTTLHVKPELLKTYQPTKEERKILQKLLIENDT